MVENIKGNVLTPPTSGLSNSLSSSRCWPFTVLTLNLGPKSQINTLTLRRGSDLGIKVRIGLERTEVRDWGWRGRVFVGTDTVDFLGGDDRTRKSPRQHRRLTGRRICHPRRKHLSTSLGRRVDNLYKLGPLTRKLPPILQTSVGLWWTSGHFFGR